MTVNLSKQHPALVKHVVALDGAIEAAATAAELDPLLLELVKIRVSQLNGCAYCLRMHVRDATSRGETPDRLAVVAAWWETQYFSPAERAALALCEEVTRLPVPEQHAWENGALSDEQVSVVSWLTILMNTWNRLAVCSHYPVGRSAADQAGGGSR